MSDMVEFARRLNEQLSAAAREPYWEPAEAERYMLAVAERREQIGQLASRLIETVVQPRLEALAEKFSNARLSHDEPPGRFSCWFDYCERFPSITKVVFAVEHDVRFEKVAVSYEASMMPQFIQFNERDRITSPLEKVLDEAIAEWVEQRLLDFLGAYLQIDRGEDDFDDESATDPVCGMRIGRSAAAASDSYRGHGYFFCSRDCQEKFIREPTAYVKVKTM